MDLNSVTYESFDIYKFHIYCNNIQNMKLYMTLNLSYISQKINKLKLFFCQYKYQNKYKSKKICKH